LAVAVGSPAQGTHVVTQPVLAKWRALGAQGGVLGYPSRDTRLTPDKTSTYGFFSKLAHGRVVYRGAIYANPVVGAHWLRGPILERYLELRSEAGPLGYPASDELHAGASGATYNDFAVIHSSSVVSRGAIYSTVKFGAHPVYGSIYEKWVALGAQHGALGFPIAGPEATPDGHATYERFSPLSGVKVRTGGAIVVRQGAGAYALLGSYFAAWRDDEDGPRVLGDPAADEVDQVVGGVALRSQKFATGTLFDSAVGRGCILYGPILTTYVQRGGPTGSLGLPTSSITVESNGDEQATFQFGTLTYVPGQGVTG
jgi:uncharacterized protein with LGFP repeats